MDFYSELEKRNLLEVLKVVNFTAPYFEGWNSVKYDLLNIVKTDARVLIYGDYDVDGLMCIKILEEGLKYVGCKNISIYPYRARTHMLDPVAVKKCIQGKFEYMIIADTGSNDLALIRQLLDRGIKVIVLDHHNAHFSYEDIPSDMSIINTTIENAMGADFRLSAGALCYTVMYKLHQELELESDLALSSYATISLFADCMDMSNELNRSIYYQARRLSPEELPKCILMFMNQWHSFNARFIGFWFAPRINAMFRSENLDVLNRLFFGNGNIVEEARCLEFIEDVYTTTRELINKVTDIIKVEELDHFVYADLYSVDRYYNVEENYLYNYTGLIANKLCERYGKTAVCYCRLNNHYKGSVRDIFGRNYLRIFQQLCYAEGHNAAFGLKINLLDFPQFLLNLKGIDKNFSIKTIENEPIIVDYPYNVPDEALIEDIALYNEFIGPKLPVVYLRKKLIGDMRETLGKYNYKYSWGTYSIQSDYRLNFGSTILIKPIKSKITKLLAVRGA